MMRRTIIALALSVLTSGISYAEDAKMPALPIVHVGTASLPGLFVNSHGALAVATAVPLKGECTVEFEKERYPAKILASIPAYDLAFIQMERQQPVSPVQLCARTAAANAKLELLTPEAVGSATRLPVQINRVRRRIPEKGLTGSYYELQPLTRVPPAGSVLVDPAAGDVYGMLIGAQGDGGESYALFASTIAEQAGARGIMLGTGESSVQQYILFADDRKSPAHTRALQFAAETADEITSAHARAIQDWRTNTGFWINDVSSPSVDGDTAYMASRSGAVYAINLDALQRTWKFDAGWPVLFPPSVSPGVVCIAAGSLRLSQTVEVDPLVTALIKSPWMKTHRYVDSYSEIDCVDRKSGVIKWMYQTQFVSRPLIIEDKVLFAGMNTLGAVRLADGKKIWENQSDRREGDVTYYFLGGANKDFMWVLTMTARQRGKGTHDDPLRLDQSPKPATVDCYSIANEKADNEAKPIWSVPIRTKPGAPALSCAILLSPDQKVIYGSTSKDLFAVDGTSGKLLWQKPVFEQQFTGNITYADSVVYVIGTENKLYAVSAVDGAVLWEFQDEKKAPLCMPLVKDGLVCVGSLDTVMYALDARDGKLVWKFETGGRICGQPAMVGDKLYCTSSEGTISEIVLPH